MTVATASYEICDKAQFRGQTNESPGKQLVDMIYEFWEETIMLWYQQ